MTEDKLHAALARLERETSRPLVVDRERLLEDFREDQEHEGTLGMKILSIIGAFMATSFFLGFIFLLGLDSAPALGLIGAGMLTGGYLFCRRDLLGVMGEAFGIALVVCGFPLVLTGVAEVVPDETGMGVVALMLAGTVLLAVENTVVSFLATVVMGGSLLFLAHDGFDRFGAHLYVGFVGVLLTVFIHFEARSLTASRLLNRRYDGIRIGLMLALLIGAGYLSDFRFWMELPRLPNWYASVVLVPLTLWVVHNLFRRFLRPEGAKDVAAVARVNSPRHWLYLGGVLVLLLPTIFAPALSATLLCLLLAWTAGYRTGTILAVVALVYFLSRYYYDLNLSLLSKSLILCASGSLFLLAWGVLYKKIAP